MPRHTTLAAAVTGAALLAAPASALADGTLVAGPLKAKGYTINLTATDAGAGDSLSVMAVKRAGASQQMHLWSFKGVAVSIKGGKATLKGNLGAFGKINARVAAGGATRGSIPAGCKGSAGSARKGTLTGTTKLVLDKGFFRTLAPKSLPAQLLTGGKLDCSGGAPGGGATGGKAGGTMLTSSFDGNGGQVILSVVKDGGNVTQQVMRTDAASGALASAMHMITAQTGASGLEAATDLSSAKAAGASPFLSGSLSFTGEGSGTVASGTVAGDFAAKFDSIGTQAVPAGTDAVLMQR
jgi:hypothetical protein